MPWRHSSTNGDRRILPREQEVPPRRRDPEARDREFQEETEKARRFLEEQRARLDQVATDHS